GQHGARMKMEPLLVTRHHVPRGDFSIQRAPDKLLAIADPTKFEKSRLFGGIVVRTVQQSMVPMQGFGRPMAPLQLLGRSSVLIPTKYASILSCGNDVSVTADQKVENAVFVGSDRGDQRRTEPGLQQEAVPFPAASGY